MNSSFWGMNDSWVQAPMMLSLYFMLRRRWIAAGICLGLAMQIKPQGLLMGPVALLAAALVPAEVRDSPSDRDHGRLTRRSNTTNRSLSIRQ